MVYNYKVITCVTLNSYKCKDQWDEFRMIPIRNDNNLVGFLIPLTYLYRDLTPEYVELICRWRMENPEGFANQFVGTIEKTERWINNVYLPREDRILFFVCDRKRNPIGHLGLSTFDFDKWSCEIDNVVRGVKQGYTGFMSMAVQTIMLWGRQTLEVDDFYLRVLADNPHAIEFYQRLGFVKRYDIPLYKVIKPDLTEWITMEQVKREPDRFYTYMQWK